jgi:hypothetical protein
MGPHGVFECVRWRKKNTERETDTNKQRERQRPRETKIQSDIESERKRHSETGRETQRDRERDKERLRERDRDRDAERDYFDLWCVLVSMWLEVFTPNTRHTDETKGMESAGGYVCVRLCVCNCEQVPLQYVYTCCFL